MLVAFIEIPKGTGILVHTSAWPGAETKGLRWHKPTKAEWRRLRKAAKERGLELQMDDTKN